MFLIGPYSYPPGTMLSAIQRLGLTSGLKVCLDASDIDCYDGTSQTWTDVSGQGSHFYRGSGSGSDAADPTFNGTAGRQSSGEYFSCDGGDYFTLAQSNPAWVQTLHKDNAKLTIAGWIYATAYGAFGLSLVADTSDAATVHGIALTTVGTTAGAHVTGQLVFAAVNSTGTAVALQAVSTAIVSLNQWTFIAVSYDETAGSGVFQINGTQESFSGTYVSPDSSSATATLGIGQDGAGNSPAQSGQRFAQLGMWDRALSATELSSLFTATRGKFGV